jgi:hypothetical protein
MGDTYDFVYDVLPPFVNDSWTKNPASITEEEDDGPWWGPFWLPQQQQPLRP